MPRPLFSAMYAPDFHEAPSVNAEVFDKRTITACRARGYGDSFSAAVQS